MPKLLTERALRQVLADWMLTCAVAEAPKRLTSDDLVRRLRPYLAPEDAALDAQEEDSRVRYAVWRDEGHGAEGGIYGPYMTVAECLRHSGNDGCDFIAQFPDRRNAGRHGDYRPPVKLYQWDTEAVAWAPIVEVTVVP